MATILRSKAQKNVSKGNTSAYYSYVEERNGTNPVIQQLEKELHDYMGFVKKKNSGLLKQGEHPTCKVSDALFDIWNKFEPRVTRRFFYQKLMLIGEFLVQNKEYATASWQCYDRYLNHFASVNFELIQSVSDLKQCFFSENNENEDVTYRALMGHCICMFHFTVGQDPKLQNNNSVQQIAEILRFLRLIMQLQLETDHFCWLVYNATIYFYTMARYLMQCGGFSKLLLEYLLFCCLSMENSIPLLGIKYLSWRSTLYVITCQCYYDCKYNDEGEMFARRALSKINELHELELASINGEQGARSPQFRDATIKIGATLFKRLVFESRRKNKGILRQKYRLVYKDLNNQQWPRTAVEKLLNEMFDCSSAQFLAVEEALNDSNRRIAMPMPAGGESEFENLDVVLELLFAAEFIVNGGGGKLSLLSSELSDFKGLISTNDTLMAMAISGVNGVQMRNYLKIVKFAYSYENWDVFRRIANKTIAHIESSTDLSKTFNNDVQIIHLLLATDKYLVHLRKLKNMKTEAIKASLAGAGTAKERKSPDEASKTINKSAKSIKNEKTLDTKSKKSLMPTVAEGSESLKENQKESEDNIESPPSPTPQETLKDEDLLSNIAYRLLSLIESRQAPQKYDLDVIVDVTLLLWRKCKEVFQKYQTGSEDNFRWVTKLENFSKWLFILNVVHEAMCYFDISTIDPAVFAHCSLRLGLTYESLANVNSRKSTKESSSLGETADDQQSMARTNNTKFTLFEMNDEINEKYGVSYDVRENLFKAQNILKRSCVSISAARASISKTDKTFMCDKNYDEENQNFDSEASTLTSTNPKKFAKLKMLKEKPFDSKKTNQTDSVSNLIADLHVELIFLFHKISMRLIEYKESNRIHTKETSFEKEFDTLMTNCKKNKISQSLIFMSKALFISNTNGSNKNPEESKVLVQKAYEKLLKVQEEDKMLFYKHVKVDAKIAIKSKIPPAPIICLRTHNKIVVQPRNFESIDNTIPSWYRIFATQLTTVNAKARISDYSFQGCGEQIPANNCEKVTISGLTPDEKYVLAVAAYDKNGKLIANSIGDSTEPILASNTLSILMSYTYLCQVCYQINEYNLALNAFEILWNHFVIKPVKPESETFISKNEVDYEVTFHQLNYNVIEKTSPILLRKFLECFFIVADIETKQKRIYCDLLFDGKIQYHNQIERIRQCEKLLLCIDLAAWLSDPQIILQAVVQIYGFLAPLIFYNLAYEPITQVLTHCLIVLEEVPTNIFQRKPKNTFESLQHMIACTTFYLTDTLKRFNKKTISNYFNLVGRKLLGLDESIPGKEANDENTEQNEPKVEDKPNNTKFNELKALEMYIAKTNASNKISYFNMLTGNEDAAQIYAFIAQNQTKTIFKELIKFRKRPNYFEYLTNLLHKALTEELSHEINDWCLETLEWLQKRNMSILGSQLAIIKKPDVISVSGIVHGHARKSLTSETGITLNDQIINTQPQSTNPVKKQKKRIRKYKLLIPVDLELSEKIKLEEKQKRAIDAIYDFFPDRYENWMRRSRLRRLFQEESAHKSQYYVIWAMNNFAILMHRINQSSPQNSLHFMQRLNSSAYLDAQQFLFDKNNALLTPFDDLNDKVNQKTKRNPVKQHKYSKDSSLSPNKFQSATNAEEKLHELKDTSEILADIISGVEYAPDENERRYSNYHSADSDHPKGPQHPISANEFSDLANNIFNKFKRAVVISHRCKQWTQLQNVCKLMFNCMNSLLVVLPAVSYNNRRTFKLHDLFKALVPACYLASENLLDMLLYTSPADKISSREMKDRINKWFDSININKTGAGLRFDLPLDDNTAVDLRFVKEFIFRSIQCLSSFEKWEKLLSIALKFNAMTGYKFAENLSPIIVNAQHKILKQLEAIGGSSKTQPHFERLKAELGRYPRVEDLFFLNFKIVIDTAKLKKLETGVKIDPRAHDIYSDDNKSKELISVPLNKAQSLKNLSDALDNSLYISRALLHARRLLSLFLISRSNETEFFAVRVDEQKSKDKETGDDIDDKPVQADSIKKDLNEIFHSNPIDFKKKTFENDGEVYIKEIHIELKTVIESYEKTIQLLLSNKEKDLVTQAMHELGNIYHYSQDINSAYRYWNEALDKLTACSNSLINWRKEFSENGQISTDKILERCGIWGCLLGGVITSKMAQYYLANDLELRTESCLLSAVLFKCIFSSTVPFSKYDLDYTKDDADHLCSEYLIPGLLFNNEMYRFDIRYIIASLNFICIELINAGYYLNAIPSITLYEYFSRNMARDLTHTVLARTIKIEALIKLNMFSKAIVLINKLHRGERLPHFIDEKFMLINNPGKHTEYFWNDSKPIYDLTNLRCLECLLSLKLSYNLVKLYGPHLTCRFYLLLCKIYVQISSCLPCMPNLQDFESSNLAQFHRTFSLVNPGSISAAKMAFSSGFNSGKKSSPDENPDVMKIFTKMSKPLKLEFIKGCLLGTSKIIILKCLQIFSQDFPRIEKYCVSMNWQREFKFECNIILAIISDQSQLSYLALQNIIDAMKELAVEEKIDPVKEKKNSKKNTTKTVEPKQSKQIKKGVFHVFDQMSKSHLNSRLWLNARVLFIQFMFNQLNDAGKAKGNDENITRDFGDLSYYCQKCLEETDKFYDNESKAFFLFIEASIDIIRGLGIQSCLDKLKQSLINFLSCRQLSQNGLINYLKASILKKDLSFALKLTNTGNNGIKLDVNIDRTMTSLVELQYLILENLKTHSGETIECYVDKNKSYFNNIMPDILNIYNPLLHYLVHIKLRLGSSLILKSSLEENKQDEQNPEYLNTCQHALNVICTGLELNKIICERSLNLEIELSYRQASCLKELFMKHKLGSLSETVDAFNYTINLIHNSTHNLNYIKNCYLEMAVLFISVFDPNIVNFRPNQGNRPGKVTIIKNKKINPTMMRAMEAALTALCYSSKASNAIKEKMLLPGHKSIKEMKSINALMAPKFVASDLVGYFVLADRKKKYRDEIEEEILSLAPEFEPKEAHKSYEEKIRALSLEADRSITWIHLLSYQSKMQNINSMRNLNTLKNGKNKFKFSDFYTIGLTPIFKNTHYMTGRLRDINLYMKTNLEIYKSLCQAPEPISDFFKILARKASNLTNMPSKLNLNIKSLYENVKYYSGNLATELSNKSIIDKEQELASENTQNVHSSKKKEVVAEPTEWSDLQNWPSNFDIVQQTIKINDSTNAESFVDYLITLNWFKNLSVSEENLISNDDLLVGIIAVKDTATNHKIKFNILSAAKVKEIHEKLAPLATIADTSLESSKTKNNENDNKNEFLNSLRGILVLISKLFDKKLDEKKFPFDLIPSNIMDLESMFNSGFGGFTNNESLKKYIFELFVND